MNGRRGSGNVDRQARGASVEAEAERLLAASGLQVVARNVRYRQGELDLVMRDGDTLVFIEVRYRRSAAFGGGAASVDAGKRRRLTLAARQFLARHPRFQEWPCRFDVVQAGGDPQAPVLDWLKDAFRGDDA